MSPAEAPVAVVGIVERFDDQGIAPVLLRLIDDAATSPPTMLLALAIAAGVGAVHALGPGHGKLLVGGYLASSRGRARDALALGGLVALMHTGSVLALGLLFHTTMWLPDSARLDAVLSGLTGVAVIAVGVVIVNRQRTVRHAHGGPQEGRDGPHRGRGHDPGPHPGHEHLPPGAQPLSRAGVTALAASGGLLPSPAAFAVLITALAIGRTGYGLALIAAFSLGLAATLAAVGLAVLFGRDRLTRGLGERPRGAALARAIPTLGGLTVVAGGLVLLLGAVAGA